MTTAASTAYCGIFQLQQQQQQPSMLASGDFPPAPEVPPTSQEEQHQQETPTASKLDPAARQHHRYPRQQHPYGSKKKQQPGADSNGGGNPGLSCELCSAKCTGEAMFQDHLKGAKHAKKVKAQQFEAQSSAKDPAVYCEVCNLTLHPELMVGHRGGLRHRKAAGEATKPGGGGQQQHRCYNKQPKKAAQPATPANNDAADASKNSSGCDQQKQPAASAADAEAQKLQQQQQQEQQMSALSKEELLKIVAKRLNMECSVCRVQFSVFANAEVHFNSRAHRAAYQKFQRDQIRSKGHVCEACDVAVNSQDLFDAHLKGYRHAVREHGGYLPEGHQFYEKYKKHQETMMSYRRKLFA